MLSTNCWVTDMEWDGVLLLFCKLGNLIAGARGFMDVVNGFMLLFCESENLIVGGLGISWMVDSRNRDMDFFVCTLDMDMESEFSFRVCGFASLRVCGSFLFAGPRLGSRELRRSQTHPSQYPSLFELAFML